MIYTDGIHLISDTSTEELHEFAEKIHLGGEWFNNKKEPRYDLFFPSNISSAKEHGAKVISDKEYKKIADRLIKAKVVKG